MDFLRSSRLALPSDFKKMDQLKLEADFFQIQPLIEELERITSRKLKEVRCHYREYINDWKVKASLTGLATEIENLVFAKNWERNDSKKVPGYIRKTEEIEILQSPYEYVETISTSTYIKDYMRSNGWNIEAIENTYQKIPQQYKEVYPHLKSMTFVKRT